MKASEVLFLSTVSAATCSVLAGPARAGTLINTNVPAGITIVNVDARTDGCAGFNSGGTSDPQAYWTQPTPGTVVSALTLGPGTYTFRVINRADAQAQFPSLTGAQALQVFDAWTYNSPWVTNYMAFKNSALTNGAETQIFDGGGVPASVPYDTSSPAAAYNSLKSSGYQDNLRLAPPGRSGTTAASFTSESYTFATTTTLLFGVPDNGLSDNGGGVSIVVAPVPEPTSALATAAVLGGATLIRRRRTAARR
jgi:hypothetical protein